MLEDAECVGWVISIHRSKDLLSPHLSDQPTAPLQPLPVPPTGAHTLHQRTQWLRVPPATWRQGTSRNWLEPRGYPARLRSSASTVPIHCQLFTGSKRCGYTRPRRPTNYSPHSYLVLPLSPNFLSSARKQGHGDWLLRAPLVPHPVATKGAKHPRLSILRHLPHFLNLLRFWSLQVLLEETCLGLARHQGILGKTERAPTTEGQPLLPGLCQPEVWRALTRAGICGNTLVGLSEEPQSAEAWQRKGWTALVPSAPLVRSLSARIQR